MTCEEEATKSHMHAPPSTHVTLVDRRTMLRQLGAVGLLLALWPRTGWTTPETVQQAIRQRIGDREPQPGGMTLTLPKIAETGNSVPLTVTVDSPMTSEEHVLRIHVFVPGNPEPVAATYHLGARAGKAQISMHIRLARTQTVLALADMSDGAVRSDAASILVTLGACVDELWAD
jgi:sulfur-oxidizing protein SoxY